jgi:uncharacterized protein YkwD
MKRKSLFATVMCLIFITQLLAAEIACNANLVDDILKQTNQFRKSKGLSELVMRPELNTIAQKHSANMAKGKVAFGHDGFSDRNRQASTKIKSLGSFAENVAYGATNALEVMSMWKNSSGHRRNLLGAYKYIGIGIAKDRLGRLFYTQVFAG